MVAQTLCYHDVFACKRTVKRVKKLNDWRTGNLCRAIISCVPSHRCASQLYRDVYTTSSLSFFFSASSKTRDTQMATRVTDGARRERHEKKESTRKARENGLSRSSDFWASKLKCWEARHVKRDLRVCLNNRGFPTFLFKAQLMQCIELVSILN